MHSKAAETTCVAALHDSRFLPQQLDEFLRESVNVGTQDIDRFGMCKKDVPADLKSGSVRQTCCMLTNVSERGFHDSLALRTNDAKTLLSPVNVDAVLLAEVAMCSEGCVATSFTNEDS